MDPVTHIASGFLGAQAARKWFSKSKVLILFSLLAAWIPDIDLFFDGGSPELSLLYHREISHSFLGGAVLALLLAGGFRLFTKMLPFWKAAILAYSLILVHIYLDLITSYGTQILAPFSRERFAWDMVFIIDPVLTACIFIFILLAAKVKGWRTYFAVMGLAWIFIYPVSNLGMRSSLEAMYLNKMDREGVEYTDFHLLPDAFTPLYWKSVTTFNGSYEVGTVTTLQPGKRNQSLHFDRADTATLERLGEQASFFKTFAWFSRFPFQRQEPEPGKIIFGDVRFVSTNPVLRYLFPERKDPFTLTAYLDSNKRLIKYTYRWGGKITEYAPDN